LEVKAIESIGMSSSIKLPEDGLSNLVDTLIDNHQIKEIDTKTLSSKLDVSKEYGNHQQQQFDQQHRSQRRQNALFAIR
jgi:hypothetical protein